MQIASNSADLTISNSQVPGGGAVELALAHRLNEKSKTIPGIGQWPYRAVAKALEVIPKTLMQVIWIFSRNFNNFFAKYVDNTL